MNLCAIVLCTRRDRTHTHTHYKLSIAILVCCCCCDLFFRLSLAKYFILSRGDIAIQDEKERERESGCMIRGCVTVLRQSISHDPELPLPASFRFTLR